MPPSLAEHGSIQVLSDLRLYPIQIAHQILVLKGAIDATGDSLVLEFSPVHSQQLRRLACRKPAASVVVENHRPSNRVLKLTTLVQGESDNILRQGNSDGHDSSPIANPTGCRKALLQRGRAPKSAEILPAENQGLSSTQLQRSRA